MVGEQGDPLSLDGVVGIPGDAVEAGACVGGAGVELAGDLAVESLAERPVLPAVPVGMGGVAEEYDEAAGVEIEPEGGAGPSGVADGAARGQVAFGAAGPGVDFPAEHLPQIVCNDADAGHLFEGVGAQQFSGGHGAAEEGEVGGG